MLFFSEGREIFVKCCRNELGCSGGLSEFILEEQCDANSFFLSFYEEEWSRYELQKTAELKKIAEKRSILEENEQTFRDNLFKFKSRYKDLKQRESQVQQREMELIELENTVEIIPGDVIIVCT